MRVEVQAGSRESVESDVLAAPLVAEERLSGPLAALNGTLGGLLARLAEQGEITGKLKTAPFVHVEGELKAARLALPGIGAREAVDADALRTAAGTLAHEARGYARTIAWLLDDSLPLAPAEQARAIVDGTLLGAYDPGRWKSSPEPQRLESLVIVSDDVAVKEAARRAGIVAEWANHARDLANSPPNELTPNGLADRAAEVGAAGSPYLSVEAPGLDEIRALGMGAFAAVAQGSHNPARLIVVRYEPPEPRGDVVLGLVGKAVTFDTGGISIKKPAYMEDMKGDMAGGGAVIAALGALAELECKLRIVGVVGATENAVGGGAYRPGDILTAMNGKTIEIINTDAEGRLILCDALSYVRRFKPAAVIDIATLTGAVVVALGQVAIGAMGNDEALLAEVREAGERAGERCWPLPLWDEYRDLLKSDIADVKNSGGRGAGSIAGGWFLREFVDGYPWVHLDIAGTAYTDGEGPHQAKGPTAIGVRLFTEFILKRAGA